MSIKPRKFKRVGECKRTPSPTTTEKGYVLGSHIRKGLYEPVNPEISGLLRGVYDEPDCKEVDPLCSYAMDKFEKAVYSNTKPDTATTPNATPAQQTE